MRKYISIVENLVEQTFDFSSVESFVESFREFGRKNGDGAKSLLDSFLSDFNPTIPPEWIELYHGTPHDRAKDIHKNGFQLTTGKRSGFMGSTNVVDNQGIFLTDKKEMAHYFGHNRTDTYGYSPVVFTAYINPKTITTFESMPNHILKIGRDILEKWDGKYYRRIPQSYQWWLLDVPEFVNELKKEGFTGVKFRESMAVRRSANSGTDTHTYLIFNPNDILLVRKVKHEDLYHWLKRKMV